MAETNANTVLEVERLTKRYGAVEAVTDVSFSVQRGRILGFVGPNGAGKTTTLRMILSVVPPTSGSVRLFGRSYDQLEAPSTRVGAALDNGAFNPGRTGRDHLRVFAHAARTDARRIDELLTMLGISDAADRAVRGYSLGMKQRLALATALLGDPDLLILDEPANGLDPAGISWLRQFLRSMAAEGKAVLVSSHLLAEMERTVDDVVLLDRGRLRYAGDRQGLLPADATVLSCRDEAVLAEVAASLRAFETTELPTQQLWVSGDPVEIDAVLAGHPGLSRGDVVPGPPTLEAAFMRMTELKKVSAG